MPQPPEIIVQIIHIEGPLKGRIQELNQNKLEIGRHNSCQIKFPADLIVISRKHATIEREGNRFKIIDHSGNGTLVNSRPIKEEYLKDGDVITVAPGGPKFSFLTEIKQGCSPPRSAPRQTGPTPGPVVEPEPPPQPVQARQPMPPQPAPEPHHPLPDYQPPPQPELIIPAAPQVEVPQAQPRASEKPASPFVVQYGPTINSFDVMPVTIGRNPGCRFVIDQPDILDYQAQINFQNSQFYLEDRTGQQRVLVNGFPLQQETLLHHNDEISLSANGPFFRFLDGGRLVEIEKEPLVMPEQQESETGPPKPEPGASPSRKIKSLFDKFLKH